MRTERDIIAPKGIYILKTATMQEVVVYFHRNVSTFSRYIGQIDAAVRGLCFS